MPARRIVNQVAAKKWWAQTRHMRRASFIAARAAAGWTQEQHGGEDVRGEELHRPRAAYVHIPFCKSRCHYCDFPIQVVGSGARAGGGIEERGRSYTDYVLREIDASSRGFSDNGGGLESIFFGGGTPSLLPSADLRRIVKRLEDTFGLAQGVEISMEADPGTFDNRKLESWINDVGLNRLSVGIQSFDEACLRRLGRSHDANQAREAARLVGSSGMQWSLDLMSGLPHSTLRLWEASLLEAVSYEPHHISVYDLQVEDSTPFARWYTPGEHPLPRDEESAEMYRAASRILRDSGYDHYEVSNYARGEGARCRHNLTYWRNSPFFGFGLGATSFVGGLRVARPRDMTGYHEWVSRLEEEEARCAGAAGSSASALTRMGGGGSPLNSSNMVDELICAMRLSDFYPIHQRVRSVFGEDAWPEVSAVIQEFESRGLVEVSLGRGEADAGRGECIRLTDPEGFLFENDVLSSILAALPEENG